MQKCKKYNKQIFLEQIQLLETNTYSKWKSYREKIGYVIFLRSREIHVNGNHVLTYGIQKEC